MLAVGRLKRYGSVQRFHSAVPICSSFRSFLGNPTQRDLLWFHSKSRWVGFPRKFLNEERLGTAEWNLWTDPYLSSSSSSSISSSSYTAC